METVDSKIIVFVAIKNETKRESLLMQLMTELRDVLVFPIPDFAEYEARIKKDPPRLVVTDVDFLKGNSVLRDGVSHPDRVYTSYIILGVEAEKGDYLDEVMLGKIHFFETEPTEEEWKLALKRAFHFSLESMNASFQIKKLKAGEHLMRAGDLAHHVYILKRGKLEVYHLNAAQVKTKVGEVVPGEFVGEMAYFNAEVRSAHVQALVESELIEIPLSSFERALYQRPAWAMQLIHVLSKRLKQYMGA